MKKQFLRFIDFWNSPYGPICTLACALAFLDTFFIDITFVTFFLLLLGAAPWLLNSVTEMELPGGFKIKTKDLEKYTREAKEAGLFKEVEPNYTQYSYFKIYEDDPNLALAGLRIEIEKRLIKIAEISGLMQGTQNYYLRPKSMGRLRDELREKGILSNRESSLLADLIPSLNQAVHGQNVTKEASDWVINDGSKILAALDDKIKQIGNDQK